MKTKLKLRLGLLAYLCLCLTTTTLVGYGLVRYKPFIVCIQTAATIVSVAASVAFIIFLQSRKPAEKNILNRQILMHFCFKLIYYPYYLTLIFFWQGSNGQHPVDWKLVLMGTLLSYNSTRIMLILSLVMYTLISFSRTFLLISPAKFNALTPKFVVLWSILILVLVFAFEIIMSLFVFSPSTCDVTPNGVQMYSMAYSISNAVIPNETNFNRTSLELQDLKVCTTFPSVRTLIVLFLVLEATRFTMAVTRKYKRIKSQNTIVKPAQPTVPMVGLQPLIPIRKCVDIKRSESFPIINVPQRDAVRRLSVQCLPRDTGISPSPKHNEPELTSVIQIQQKDHTNSTQTPSELQEMKTYVSFLILRTYTLVIFIIVLWLVSFLVPNRFFSLLVIQTDLFSLDLYFVPVFWILIDKDVWRFTLKNCRKIFLSIVVKFSRE